LESFINHGMVEEKKTRGEKYWSVVFGKKLSWTQFVMLQAERKVC
jgi:hypothetical protein